ncbi:MaoC family dehydratase [Brevibacterium luteolum]|uniref:Dehydratase n=1 Tax=Brevibacterium luteolum TaxID=199591 RepID=A0A2N6PIW3_9MICO|nr:MaoC family dehydratase [Brevibacterium luteolum]MCT1922570.1 MaoC family dehydratase [Brevibacterium luteolum]PMB98623.1 dehydratase [Brevibacterium luteolum]
MTENTPSPQQNGAADAAQPDAAEPTHVIQQRGLWFEEFEIGAVYKHAPGRTITEADNTWFTAVTMNTQALHLDAAFAETEPFGQRLVNSMFTLATLVGLSVSQLTQGTIVGNLGFSEVAFPKPLFHGDTLYAETKIVDKRLSNSRPGQGIVSLEHIGRNQRGDIVAKAVRKTMVFTSDHATAGKEA